MRIHLVSLLFVSLLAGCSVVERFDSAESRINAALPPDTGVQVARQLLLAQVTDRPQAKQALEPAWAARLRLRANSCSRDYTPTWRDSKETIRERLGGSACLAEFDRTLQRWLGLQRVRLLLAQDPIRPTPQSLPKVIAHQEFISTLVPATEAAVAIVRGPTRFDVLDLANGKSLFGELTGNTGDSIGSLSPNGRMFTQTRAGKVAVRATDGGETLVELPQAEGLLWLGTEAVGLRGKNGGFGKLRLLDLATGDDTPVPTSSPIPPDQAVRVPGAATRYNLLQSHTGVEQIELVKVGDRMEAQLRAEKRLTGRGFAINTGGLTPDGSTWVDGSQSLRLLNLETLEVEELSFAPVTTQTAWPTPNPDEFLVSMHLPSGDGITSHFNYYVYARRAGTLAQLKRDPGSGMRYQYIAAVKRLVLIDNQTLRYVDGLPTAAAQPVAVAVSAFIDEMNQRRLAASAAQAAAAAAQPMATLPSGPFSAAAPLLAGLRDTQVEGVGVYEGAGPRHGVGMSRSPGAVEVIVRRSSRPVALVLSSYEPVRWRITLLPGAQLSTVLLGGYHESMVIGAGNARVVNIGQSYAYSQDGVGYIDLQRHVTRWVGRPISFFQGRYQGGSFTVGGS